ncbi:MAG TPA: GNAT family N-acetyltransferase [Candidatus Cloacimonadota bacterium]|nr:GNAT family N-acetyltransferase [Candidatus Cloacimonadota bacterium]
MDFQFYPIKSHDLPEIMQIQKECYSEELLESMESFEHKLKLSPDTCYLIKHNNETAGYYFSLPCMKSHLPSFNDNHFQIPAQPDCLYLHDLAIKKAYRKQGIPTLVFQHVSQYAFRLNIFCFRIFSVQNTYEKWKAYGFRKVTDLNPELTEKINSFQGKAVLMELNISPSAL